MQVTIHYLAQVRRAAGLAQETLTVAPPCTLAQLVVQLTERYPEPFRILAAGRSLLFFINDDHAGPEHPLADGDEVTILAPMAGG